MVEMIEKLQFAIENLNLQDKVLKIAKNERKAP